jgi:hypothetical protein
MCLELFITKHRAIATVFMYRGGILHYFFELYQLIHLGWSDSFLNDKVTETLAMLLDVCPNIGILYS